MNDLPYKTSVTPEQQLAEHANDLRDVAHWYNVTTAWPDGNDKLICLSISAQSNGGSRYHLSWITATQCSHDAAIQELFKLARHEQAIDDAAARMTLLGCTLLAVTPVFVAEKQIR